MVKRCFALIAGLIVTTIIAASIPAYAGDNTISGDVPPCPSDYQGGLKP